MARQRVQVPEGEYGDTRIRPAASPVNRFSSQKRPDTVLGETKTQQFAQAWSQFAPQLTRFLVNEDQRETEAQIIKARTDRAKSGLMLGEAVKRGDIPADANPWYIKQWKHTDGQVMADEYNRDLLIAMSSGPLANATDHDKSQELLNTFRENWKTEKLANSQDADFLDGFDRKARAYEVEVQRAQTQRVGANIVAAAGETFSVHLQGIIEEMNTRNLSQEAVADAINAEKESALFVGMKPQDVNGYIAQAISTEAENHLDTSVLDILDKITTGPGGFLGKTSTIAELKEKTTNAIYNRLHQLDTWENEKENRLRESNKRSAAATISKTMLQNSVEGNPSTLDDLKIPLEAIASTGDFTFLESMKAAITKSQKEPDRPETDSVVRHWLIALNRDRSTDIKGITKAFEAQDINRASFNGFTNKAQENANYLEQQSKKDQEGKGLKDPFQMNAKNMLTFYGADMTNVMFPSTVLEVRQEAEAQYWLGVSKWKKDNPKATYEQESDFAAKWATQVRELIPVPPDQQFITTDQAPGQSVKSAPGVKSGKVKPLSTEPEPLPKPILNESDFDEALLELKTKGTASRIARMAAQAGKTPGQWILEQQALYPPQQ